MWHCPGMPQVYPSCGHRPCAGRGGKRLTVQRSRGSAERRESQRGCRAEAGLALPLPSTLSPQRASAVCRARAGGTHSCEQTGQPCPVPVESPCVKGDQQEAGPWPLGTEGKKQPQQRLGWEGGALGPFLPGSCRRTCGRDPRPEFHEGGLFLPGHEYCPSGTFWTQVQGESSEPGPGARLGGLTGRRTKSTCGSKYAAARRGEGTGTKASRGRGAVTSGPTARTSALRRDVLIASAWGRGGAVREGGEVIPSVPQAEGPRARCAPALRLLRQESAG